MTWDDFRRSDGSTPATPAKQRVQHLPFEALPKLVRDMLDDPSRPRARDAAETYAIRDYIVGKWHDAAGLRDMSAAESRAFDERCWRAAGYDPASVEPGYATVVYHAVQNRLRLDYMPVAAEEDEPAGIDVIPDEGMTIVEYAEAIGTSKRTAEKRIGALIGEGAVVAVDEPTGRGGMPRKRYYRAGTEPATEA